MIFSRSPRWIGVSRGFSGGSHFDELPHMHRTGLLLTPMLYLHKIDLLLATLGSR